MIPPSVPQIAAPRCSGGSTMNAPVVPRYFRLMRDAPNAVSAIRSFSYRITVVSSVPITTRCDAARPRCSCSTSPGSRTGRGSCTSRQTGIAASRYASAFGRGSMPEKGPRTPKKKPISLVIVMVERARRPHSHRKSRPESSAGPAFSSKSGRRMDPPLRSGD